jgi:prefoldin subunit 5
MKKLNTIFILVMLCGLSACASMSKNECLNANWKTIGYEDGSLGRAETMIQQHRKACAKVNVSPDLNQYLSGHREGVRVYCKKSTGYQLGVSGGAYANICPADLEPLFLKAYRIGQELFSIRQEISRIESAVTGYRNSIADLEKQKQDAKQLIVESSSAKEKRLQLKEIDGIDNEIRYYERDIADAQHQLDHLHRDYSATEAEHRQMGY